MARRLPDGSIELSDGRIVYANSIILGADLCEIIPLCVQPAWPITHGRAAQSALFVGMVGVGSPGAGTGGGPGGGGGGGGGGGSVGPQGLIGPPGPGSGIDLFASTRIVSLIPGDGTDLTIASALAALPVQGGKIFIKQGVYNEAATLLVPPDRSVVIQGAGKGATTINIVTPGIPLFQVGAAGVGIYGFRDFTVTGDAASAQAFLDLQAAVDVSVENVDVESVRDIVLDALGAEVLFRSCSFSMPAIANCSFWRGAGSTGLLTWLNTEATLPTTSTAAITGQPDWYVTSSYIGGPAGLSVYILGLVIWQGFDLDRAEVRITRPGSRIVNLRATDVSLRVRASDFTIANAIFANVATTADPIRLNEFATAGAKGYTITGCVFDGAALAIRAISTSAVDSFVVEGCTFQNFTTEDILVSGSSGTIDGCRFETSVTAVFLDATSTNNVVDGCVMENATVGVHLEGLRNIVSSTRFDTVTTPIEEVGAADFNLFDAINGFAGSVVIGANSVVGTVIN